MLKCTGHESITVNMLKALVVNENPALLYFSGRWHSVLLKLMWLWCRVEFRVPKEIHKQDPSHRTSTQKLKVAYLPDWRESYPLLDSEHCLCRVNFWAINCLPLSKHWEWTVVMFLAFWKRHQETQSPII